MGASIGLAVPADEYHYGYLSEHSAFGENEKVMGDFAEDLASTMLATTLGIDFDPQKDYDERREIYRMSGKIVDTFSTYLRNQRQTGFGQPWWWRPFFCSERRTLRKFWIRIFITTDEENLLRTLNFLGLDETGLSPETADILIQPIPYDSTTSFQPGTRFGPEAILQASHQVELWDEELGWEPMAQ